MLQAQFTHNNKNVIIDFSKPINLAIPLQGSSQNLTAWYVEAPKIEPVVADGWIGSVAQGGSVNFRNIQFNPHGHGTHTECVGHITPEIYSVNNCITQYFFWAKLISVLPENIQNDEVITKTQLQQLVSKTDKIEAVLIRTLPNNPDKLNKQYSNTNPPYLMEEAAQYLTEIGIKHLLIDTPSVDREVDGGELKSHHAFWNTKGKIRFDCTITEMFYADNKIEDGLYLLNLQFAAFENDASPSRPVLFKPQIK